MDISYKIGWFLGTRVKLRSNSVISFVKMGRMTYWDRIGRFLTQTPLGTQPGLGTQLRYEALGDLRFEIIKSVVINIRLVRLSS